VLFPDQAEFWLAQEIVVEHKIWLGRHHNPMWHAVLAAVLFLELEESSRVAEQTVVR
jgi:hypothetical protein